MCNEKDLENLTDDVLRDLFRDVKGEMATRFDRAGKK